MTSQHGKELVEGAVYEFHKPDPGKRMQVEIVFMHGLQLTDDDLKHAYFETWRTSDDLKEVWPETWLKEKYPNARILSLTYDSSARETETAGNMDPYLVAGCLLDQMVSTEGNIGQNDCPVVFVGHSLGGLIAKEIVVRCHDSDRANAKYENLLLNLKAVFFYATPHGGSAWADSWFSYVADHVPFVRPSSWVKTYLKPEGTERTHIQKKFLEAVNKDCKFYVVAEGRKPGLMKGFKSWIVGENSATFPGPHDFVMLRDADHMTVCKPKSKADTGYVKLIECVDQVIEEYTSRITVHLSVVPIGIEGKIDDISKLLERPQVSIVGLFGMGGVGKTTLSKAFYNLEAFKYVRSCYLENVTSKEVQDVKIVQKELLQGLCGEQLNQDEQVKQKHLDMIKHCFQTQKVLVVIDDVSSEDCLQELQVFHALETTGSQSKVIVTGGDSRILPRKHPNKVVIEPVNGITEDDGMKLFFRYALDAIPDEADKEKVKIEFLGEAKKIVHLCNGRPLSLEVLGKYLGNSKDKDEDLQQWKETWTDAYERLQKAESIDGDKLWSTLQISYKSLDPIEKKMFLDFACIFSEMEVEKRLVGRIWGSSTRVKNLISKSLLKEEGGHYVMHDQLRDMGRYMLLKEVLKETHHPIYLWESLDKHFSKTYKEFKESLESDVPYVASVGQEVGTNSLQYSKLRFFNATGCDTPSSVDVCLSHCSKELQWLYLKNCSGVTKLGIQKLCSLGGLRVLQIYKCNKIVEFPEEICKLTSLVEMEVVQCSNLLSLPNNIGKLTNLKRLVIAYCRGLQVLPDNIGDLCEVEHLSFQGCDKLKVIHGTQICTKKLMQLRLSIVPTTCLPPCPQLQRLDIANAQGAKEFPQDFFKIDMPKLEVVNFTINPSVHMVFKNPDGSELVLEKKGTNPRVLEVKRHTDGSISQLRERRTLCPQRSLQFEAFEWVPKFKTRRGSLSASASDPQTI